MTEIQASMISNSGALQPGQPQWFNAERCFATLDEAREWASQFPKALRVRATTLGGCPGLEAIVKLDVRLTPTGVTQSVNETGIKRMRRFLALCGETTWKAPFTNSYQTREEFFSAITGMAEKAAAEEVLKTHLCDEDCHH